MPDSDLAGIAEEYPRIHGFKVLAVFEDHTGGGTARIFYAVHPDGRGMVQITSRATRHAGGGSLAQVFPDHEDARRYFVNSVQRYIPLRSSVSP